MSRSMSLGRQITRRLALATLLAGLVGSALAVWGFLGANARAVDSHLEVARGHYQGAIAQLERRLGREAFNFRVRLEALRHLEQLPKGKEQLLAYLISQGGNIEFPSLRIEDARGEIIASYEYAGRSIPDARFQPGQETAWAWDPVQGRLYLVHRQYIWLGGGNGRLVLYKPMDNALLTQLAYPQTRLSLWWGDRLFASSDGNAGLEATAAAMANGRTAPPNLGMPWGNGEGDIGPRLLIESTAPDLLKPLDLALPMAIGFLALTIALWLTLGTWGAHMLERLRSLERALEGYLERGSVDAEVERDLNAEHGREHDEIAELAGSIEHLMRDRDAGGPGSEPPAQSP